ncbi:MAG: T9SS type A sorting domain-containing protein [Bacteroidota bacterium]|nr:T9SS type A sorting domain-containing protein [Bacteroidota bacterium]
MKTSILCIAALLTGSALTAQITLTQGDIAPYYTTIHLNNDTTPTVTEGSPGANQTYNLSALNAQGVDTLVFSDPNWTPNGANFPGSNEVLIYNTNQAFVYFANSSTSSQITGQAADPIGSGIIDIPYYDYEKAMDFPFSYNSTFTDVARGTAYTYLGYDPGIGFQVDSVRIKTTVFKTSTADGYGDAITPLDTFNVLRINTIRRQVDTIDIQTMNNWIYDAFIQEDSVRNYTFWANGIGFPVAELSDYQDFGIITSATWIPTLPQYNVGVSEFAAKPNLNVYPNPSVETVTFVSTGSNAAVIYIMNASGQIVRSANVTADKTAVNVSDLASGMYFYQAVDAHGFVVEKGKLNVYH